MGSPKLHALNLRKCLVLLNRKRKDLVILEREEDPFVASQAFYSRAEAGQVIGQWKAKATDLQQRLDSAYLEIEGLRKQVTSNRKLQTKYKLTTKHLNEALERVDVITILNWHYQRQTKSWNGIYS